MNTTPNALKTSPGVVTVIVAGADELLSFLQLTALTVTVMVVLHSRPVMVVLVVVPLIMLQGPCKQVTPAGPVTSTT